MANEFIHIDPGAILTKAEFELITGHQFNSQATGDILYASTSTQLSRLGIGSNTNVLEITGGVPAWVATSGTGSVARVSSPTFVTPALGTPASGVMTNVSGTASSLTAGTVTTNANLTGVVTSSGNATSIADKALAIAKLADGTDGELITWNASGVIAVVAAGNADQILTSNGAGAAPTFQAAAAGGPSQANQAALEAETNEDTYAPPDLIKHSPGVAKVWAAWEQDGAHGLYNSYNYTSVTDGGGAGDTDHVFADDFSASDQNAITFGSQTIYYITANIAPSGVGTLTTVSRAVADNTATDRTYNWITIHGDQ